MTKKKNGFTLIEVLVAMVIMIGAVIVVANAWSGNFSRVRSARINNVAATLLERKMTQIEHEYYDKSIDELKEEDGGDFGAMYPGYRWEMKSQEFEMPDLSGALIADDGPTDQTLITIMKTTAEFFKKSVKEVSVTVIYRPRKGNEIKHTVTSFLVDYSKELPIPGM